MLAEEVKEFCSETSIHGLSQIANGQYSILKRLLWFAIFAGCLAYAGNQLVNSIKGNVIETKKTYSLKLNKKVKSLSFQSRPM